ncbi:COP23 domain-containing protein [Myxosarcina sp. GI1(2024)]
MFNTPLRFLVSQASLAVGLVSIASTNSVNAFPLSSSNNSVNLDRLRQLIAQNNEPPEVIIDDAPSTANPIPTRRASSDTRFSCEIIDGEYTVMYYPESQPNRAYPWAIPSQLGGGWTPERRCNEITRRFESYRQDGLLELTTDVENNYDIVCVTTQVDPSDCRIVLTVPPGQDPQLTRDLVFENLLAADDGQRTQGVYTLNDDRTEGEIFRGVGKILGEIGINPASNTHRQSPESIDLRPFLDPTDGGTASQLKPGNFSTPNDNRQPVGSPASERKPAIFR